MTSQPDNALSIVRVFNASSPEVFNAWSDPALIKKWWGPKHFTSPFCSLDFREGGTYLFCMRSPEGKDYWSTGKYLKIVTNKLIQCSDSFADDKGNVVSAAYYGMGSDFPLELLVTVSFGDRDDGSCELILKHEGIPAGEMADLTKAGWNESLDKLASLVAKP